LKFNSISDSSWALNQTATKQPNRIKYIELMIDVMFLIVSFVNIKINLNQINVPLFFEVLGFKAIYSEI